MSTEGKSNTPREARREKIQVSVCRWEKKAGENKQATHRAKRVYFVYYFQPAAGERKPRKGEETLSVTKLNYKIVIRAIIIDIWGYYNNHLGRL